MKDNEKRKAFQFIILLGLVSLFGDITYEGARSVAGPYLALLGASSLIVGLVGGIGEFLGYALRLLSGFIADRTRAYWPIVVLGYGLLFAIPLMAIADTWLLAAIFLVLERAGKGIRAPARDAILSHATKKVGRGLGFGLHEAIDQIGAIIGPLVLSAVSFVRGDYRLGFIILTVPAVLSLAFLLIARGKVPSPEAMETKADGPLAGKTGRSGIGKSFWIYCLFCFISVAGLLNFQIISFHFKVENVISDAKIPLLYALAMGVDAISGVLIGRLYDKVGFPSLISVPLLGLPVSFLALSSNPYLGMTCMVLWGAIMGIHETIMRAAIADMTSIENRGKAYGLFNTIYGLAFLAGSAVSGWLYGYSWTAILIFTTVLEGTSFLIILRWIKES